MLRNNPVELKDSTPLLNIISKTTKDFAMRYAQMSFPYFDFLKAGPKDSFGETYKHYVKLVLKPSAWLLGYRSICKIKI